MTYSPMKDLKEFHDRFSPFGENRDANKPHMMSLLNKRRKLIKEEYNEVIEAIENLKYAEYTNPGQPTGHVALELELAKELADLLYVVYGTAEELGIDLEGVFQAVHESNMAKLWPDGQVHYNEYGKILKPPTYSPPDLSFIHEHRV
jgi:predicted HAD superfamily Cof-like phosphohydrolase